jgi:hypothetical protein
MKKASEFRLWVNELYQRNCIERDGYKMPCLEVKEYFNQYKYWLKREFQYQKNQK